MGVLFGLLLGLFIPKRWRNFLEVLGVVLKDFVGVLGTGDLPTFTGVRLSDRLADGVPENRTGVTESGDLLTGVASAAGVLGSTCGVPLGVLLSTSGVLLSLSGVPRLFGALVRTSVASSETGELPYTPTGELLVLVGVTHVISILVGRSSVFKLFAGVLTFTNTLWGLFAGEPSTAWDFTGELSPAANGSSLSP